MIFSRKNRLISIKRHDQGLFDGSLPLRKLIVFINGLVIMKNEKIILISLMKRIHLNSVIEKYEILLFDAPKRVYTIQLYVNKFLTSMYKCIISIDVINFQIVRYLSDGKYVYHKRYSRVFQYFSLSFLRPKIHEFWCHPITPCENGVVFNSETIHFS
jgi:hypothetical protein